MKRVRKKSLKRHRATVNNLDSLQKQWHRIYAAEAKKYKNPSQFKRWALRNLSKLAAALIIRLNKGSA